jgi:cytochrome P450
VSWLPALDGWLVTSRELALQAMRDAETFTVDDPRFSTGQVVGPSMLTLDGDEHARHRGPFARPFRLDAGARAVHGRRLDETERLIDGLEPAGRAELRRGLAGPLARAIVTVALGLADEDTGAVLGWYDRIVAAVTEVTEGRPSRVRARGVRRAARERGARVPGRRRRSRPRDEVVSNVAVLMFGGIETTEGMIANACCTCSRTRTSAPRSSGPSLLRTRSRSRCGSSRPPR